VAWDCPAIGTQSGLGWPAILLSNEVAARQTQCVRTRLRWRTPTSAFIPRQLLAPVNNSAQLYQVLRRRGARGPDRSAHLRPPGSCRVAREARPAASSSALSASGIRTL
jgi:hypothetical protein